MVCKAASDPKLAVCGRSLPRAQLEQLPPRWQHCRDHAQPQCVINMLHAVPMEVMKSSH